MSFTGESFFKFSLLLRFCLRCGKQVGNTEPGVIEETIRTKEQTGNENDLEPSTTIAGKLETTQLSPPDQVFVNVSDGPCQPKNYKDLRK